MGPGTPGPAESGAIEMSDKLLKPCIFKTKVTARLTAPRDRNLLALALAILIASPSLLKAGEVEGLYEAKIDDADVSDKSPPIKVGPHQKFKLCAIASGYYTYSGQQDTFFGIPIEVSPASTNEEAALTGSVGAGGRNRPGDVRSVQRALIALGLYTDPANGQVSNNLLAAITAFQKQFAAEEADGSIKPNSKTASLLFSKNRYAMFPLRGEVAIAPDGEGYTFQAGAHEARRHAASVRCVEVSAPGAAGRYAIKYGKLVSPLPDGRLPLSIGEIAKSIRSGPKILLAHLDVTADATVTERPFSLNITLGGDVPASGGRANLKPGFSDLPVQFGWFTETKNGRRNTVPNVEFRHRLYPVEEWSPWTNQRAAMYFFILPGSHSFQVEARFRRPDATWQNGGLAAYDFSLSGAFVSKPDAGTKGIVPVSRETHDLHDIYRSSHGFIAGVRKYDSAALAPLPLIERDIDAVSSALGRLGFDVKHTFMDKTTAETIAALEAFMTTLSKDDRVVLYFSMHGVQEKDAPSRGYLATKDCSPSAPRTTCISFDALREYAKRMRAEKGVRHVAILINSCAAGFGNH